MTTGRIDQVASDNAGTPQDLLQPRDAHRDGETEICIPLRHASKHINPPDRQNKRDEY